MKKLKPSTLQFINATTQIAAGAVAGYFIGREIRNHTNPTTTTQEVGVNVLCGIAGWQAGAVAGSLVNQAFVAVAPHVAEFPEETPEPIIVEMNQN